MPAMIIPKTRTVFHAPTKGRSYFTARAAANQEAGAIMSLKYPAQQDERDEFGRPVERAWHWANDDRLRMVRDRLARRILNRMGGT